MKFFLRIKHWQLFSLLIGLPLLLELIGITTLFITKKPTVIIIIFPLLILSIFGMYLAWFRTLAVHLHAKLPETVQMNLTRFKILWTYPVIYFIALLTFGFCILRNPFLMLGVNPMLFLIIIPFHFFAVFCMFYMLYFIAKSFKSAELQKPVTFGEYAGEFALFWIFPIGVWVLQPRINKLFEEKF